MSKYESMTDEQIRETLKTLHGVSMRADASRATLEKKLADIESGANRVVKAAPAEKKPESDDVVSQLSGRKVKVKIFSSKDEKYDVPITLNGRNYLLQRDKEIEVPEEVYFILRDAVVDDYYQNDGDKTLYKRSKPQFPYTLVG